MINLETGRLIPSAEVVELQNQIEAYGGDPEEYGYYGPWPTHCLYMRAETIPRLSVDEIVTRRTWLRQLGYQSIAGAWVGGYDCSVRQALRYLGSNHAERAARNELLVGPYCLSDEISKPGVMVYAPR